MKKLLLATLAAALAATASAEYRVERTEQLALGEIEGKGQVLSPSRSPEGNALVFEYLAADGESHEVYLAEIENETVFPPSLKKVRPAVPSVSQDVFSVGAADEKTVSEQAAWGPPTRRGAQLVFAATRREASRGGSQINFDLMYLTRGKNRFITEHPENDSEPSFSPGGEYITFASGRTGEGDIYLYSLFSEGELLKRLTFEESGSELYPIWSHDGKHLAYTGHLGGADHLLVIDDMESLIAIADEDARKIKARELTRDLTAGWRHSCLAPSISPDDKWIAFYMHPKGQVKSDLYLVAIDGGEPRLLMENVVPGTHSRPAWSPDSKGLFVVEENAREMNPIVYVPIDASKRSVKLDTGTQLNVDVTAWGSGDVVNLLFAAQGGGEKDREKRWRKIFAARLIDK